MRTHTTKTLALMFLATVVVSAAAGYLLWLVVGLQERLLAQIAQIQETEAQATAYLQLRRISEQTTDERAQLAQYYLPSQNDSIELLALLEEQWGPQLGVIVEPTNLDREESDVTDGQAWMALTVRLEGSRTGVRDMIRILENIPYQSTVRAISLSQLDESVVSASVEMRIMLQRDV